MHGFYRLYLLKKERNKSGMGGEQSMVESVRASETCPNYSCNKKRRSEKVFVRLKILKTCQAKIACEIHMKWKAEEGFKVYTGGR